MTKTILEAIKNNESNFKDIDEDSKKIQNLIKEKEETMNEILKVYKVVFQSFNTERKETPITLPKDENDGEGGVIFINKNGISIRDRSYQENTAYIESYSTNAFIGYLKRIKTVEKDLLPYIRANKQKIFLNFLEKVHLLETKEDFVKNIQLEVYDENQRKIDMGKVRLNPRNIRFEPAGEGRYYSATSATFNYPSLRDKLIIEQIYNELKLLLEEYNEIEQKNIDDAKEMLEDLKTKFAKQLIVKSLFGKKK